MLPLIKVKGNPTTKTAAPSTVATASPGLSEQEIGGRGAGGHLGFERLSPARARQGVRLRVAAKMRTVRRGAITAFIGWNLSSVRFQGASALGALLKIIARS